MRYLSMIRIDETTGQKPSERLQNEMGKLMEVVGGYAILEADSREEAIELTERFLQVHGDEWDVECEVRPLDGEEFGPPA